jgi:hypothetical protein
MNKGLGWKFICLMSVRPPFAEACEEWARERDKGVEP